MLVVIFWMTIFSTGVMPLSAEASAANASSTVGSPVSPSAVAVVSLSSVSLFSGVPSCVGLSARTMSYVLACPETGVSFTRPG